MPMRPLKPCPAPGCPELVRKGRCSKHEAARHRAIDEQRGSSSERGYDVHWQRIRAQFLRLHPLCIQCGEEGRVQAAAVVDHILPLSEGGTNEHANLRPYCKPHHDARTMRDQVNARRSR